ncbi:MAG: phosphoribosylformylglycinamidine cyclo-ligase [Saprospiraceae bacterium]|jgi:phosphoribosylformylglycinamidine cyclo-ligase
MSGKDTSRYNQRGVSASKGEVHAAIKNLDKGLYPLAFCKMLPDLVGGDPEYANIMHADTAGTKTSLAYIYWKETGDMSVWTDIIQDAIVMNIDDMACTGCVSNIILSSTIGRNKSLISGDVIKGVIQGTQAFVDKMKALGIDLTLAGGETADVGDIVRTIDVGITAFGRIKRSDAIVNDMQDGDVIVGLSSYGEATYEQRYNGGMGSNGLTSARHDILSSDYRVKYPESYDPHISKELIYCGSKKLTDEIVLGNGVTTTVGKLILSPTRTYIPILSNIISQHKDQISGIIHCTGGAQTKVLKFVKNKKIVKNNLLPIPPLFKMIEDESGTSRKEMYEVFNMGHRMEIYCNPSAAEDIILISKKFNVEAQIVGYVENSESNQLVIQDSKGEYRY